jgi:hypothetical protein
MSDKESPKEGEPHPAAFDAKHWLLEYFKRHEEDEAFMLIESFVSCAFEQNWLAKICGETSRRLLHGEPVNDRYLLGLARRLRNMEEDKRPREASSRLHT